MKRQKDMTLKGELPRSEGAQYRWGNRWENNGNHDRVYFFLTPESLQRVNAALKLKDTRSLEEKL